MRVFGRSLHNLIGYLRKGKLSNIFSRSYFFIKILKIMHKPHQEIKYWKERKNVWGGYARQELLSHFIGGYVTDEGSPEGQE